MSRPPAALGGHRRLATVVIAFVMIAALSPLVHNGGRTRAEASASGSGAGSAGIVTALPSTPSAATVSGRGVWSNLQITVNQTKDLVNQAISVSWNGGLPTYSGADATSGFNGRFSGDYLQVFECWGDDDGTVPSNPGPPPEQCEFGGQAINTTSYPANSGAEYQRAISLPGYTCSALQTNCLTYTQALAAASSDATQIGVGGIRYFLDAQGGAILDPFKAVDGTIVPASVNPHCCDSPPYSSYDTNPYFNFNTTNEVDFSRTFADGTGLALFEADTGLQAPGLGCGQQGSPDGANVIPKCWLVAVPRGTAASDDQLVGSSVATSPLDPTVWANRIAIPLTFEPIGTSCAIGANQTRIVGSELAARAVASWQPTLCAIPGTNPYSYAAIGDDNARQQLLGSGTGGTAGMAVISTPVNATAVDPNNPVLYAPITLSGIVVGFNIERTPSLVAGQLNPTELPLAGDGVLHINLTPRLVAKLLTQSYRSQFYPTAPSSYAWVVNNPGDLAVDPDFLQYNPEFSGLTAPYAIADGTLLVEEPSSDAAAVVWQWVMADPAARAWLSGQPDPWGMMVNPYFTTTASANPAGSAFDNPPINNYPKSDPYCFVPVGENVGNPPQQARNLCFQDWAPYSGSMSSAASATRSANNGAKTLLNIGATGPDTAWTSNGPQVAGTDFIMSITSTDQAAQFGLQTASLSQAGDDGASPTFIAADSNGLLAGAGSMTHVTGTNFLSPNPGTTASGAYPLTMLTYAATTPVSLSTAARQAYSTFLTYAGGAGQSPGTAFGSLPLGFVPLPSDLASQTTQAAATVLNPPTPTTTTTSTTSTTTTPAPATAVVPASTIPTTAASAPVARSSGPRASETVQSKASGSPTVTPTTVGRSVAGPASVAAEPLGPTSAATVSRSPRTVVGAVRFAFPAALLLGLLAAIGMLFPGGQGRLRSNR